MGGTMNPQLQNIIDAGLPSVQNPDLRKEPRKAWAKQVRTLFKAMGLTGISVTTPNYSMASAISIELPKAIGCNYDDTNNNQHPHLPQCPACQQKEQAERKLEQILYAAFPDMNDRSDYVSDYFDNCFSIH
jgi:hypothetical protein